MSGKDANERKVPVSLWFAALVAILMGAMYIFRVFSYLTDSIEEDDILETFVITFFAILYFAMFVRLLMSVFGLPSGNRRSWRSTVRMGVAYIATTVVCYMGIGFMTNDMVFGEVTIPSWAMSVVMAILAVYMFRKEITDFFTPTYADPVGLSEWVMYLFGRDPFRGKRFRV